ncbi:MAG: M20/M25/M40 family metallo-hydrolase [Bacteroidales bacterium]
MNRTIQLLRDLVAIDSVNPSLVPGGAGEQEIGEAILSMLRGAGIDAELEPVAPGRPNVVGVLEGRQPGPALVLCGHLDTVGVEGMVAPFDPVIRDNRMYGRGAEDMKGGLAAIVGAALTLAERGGLARGRVIVAGVADEEDASRGVEAFVQKWRGDFAVVAEPTALRVGIAHKGFAWIEVATHGVAAHGSRPSEGRDAIFRMGRILTRLEALDRALQARPGHRWLGTPSLHASTIAGGREWSTYPDRCTLRVERRTLPGEGWDAPLMEVTRILEALVEEDDDFSASAALTFGRPPHEIAEDADFVRRMRDAARGAGASGEVAGISFWADSAVLAQAGTPTVLFGPGGAGLHATEEYVSLDDVLVCENALIGLATSLL